jgi:hypothetical protein
MKNFESYVGIVDRGDSSLRLWADIINAEKGTLEPLLGYNYDWKGIIEMMMVAAEILNEKTHAT